MKTQRRGGSLISKIHRLQGRIFARLMKDHGISSLNPAQIKIVFALWEHGEMSISGIAEKTTLKKSGLTSMLSRLELKGFIERAASIDDKRITLISLTTKDKKLINAFDRLSEEMIEQFYEGLSEKEIDSFEHTLGIILENLKFREQ